MLSSLPLPQAKILRLGRTVRVVQLLRELSLRNAIGEFLVNRAGSAVYPVLFLIILVLEFGSMAILFTEQGSPEANIKTASDAIWWVLVTIYTVVYGDQFPTAAQGRLVAVLVLIVGVALFGVVTGFLANAFEYSPASDDRDFTSQPAVADSSAILEEITRLRQVQEKANHEYNEHLAQLVARLEQAQSKNIE